jgi:hypothetical protein
MTNHKPPTNAAPSSTSELLDRLASPLENVANLVSLASAEAECPEKVRLYMQMAGEQMQIIRQIALQ